jgi:hypothetical protein
MCVCVLSTAVVLADDEFDCTQGCPILDTLKPVCGSDKRTYGSACFAYCQGVKKYKDGPCTGGSNIAASMATADGEQKMKVHAR